MQKLVRTLTKDSLYLNGLYTPGDKAKSATLFIHGFMTDFYSHDFYQPMVDAVSSQGHAIIMAQHRGTGIYTEFITQEKEGKDIGSYYELLEEAHLDISAWIEFLLNEGYQSVTLIGHSLGTIKIVRYMIEGAYKDKVNKLVLISPFDKTAYIEDKTKGEWKNHVEFAREKVNTGKALELITNDFDDYLTTFQTYLSWYDTTDMNRMFDFYNKDYKSPILEQIKVPVVVIAGKADNFLYIPSMGTTLEDVEYYLKNNIKNMTVHFIDACGHVFTGYEDQLASLVSDSLL